MQPDPWLTRWLPPIQQHAAHTPVLEIGCGAGEDTATLVAAGLRVVAFDLSASAVEQARAQVPGAAIHVQDVRDAFPDGVQGTGVVVASLSLHYFAWAETLVLFDRVRRTLAPGGLLVCRLNSTEDITLARRGIRRSSRISTWWMGRPNASSTGPPSTHFLRRAGRCCLCSTCTRASTSSKRRCGKWCAHALAADYAFWWLTLRMGCGSALARTAQKQR